MTLTELLVAMIVFGMAMTMIMGAVVAVLRVTRGAEAASDAAFNTRQALAIIDRQVRSGNVLFSPADEAGLLVGLCSDMGSNSGNCMRIFTQSNGEEKCVQWAVVPDPDGDDTYLLQMRSWRADWQTSGAVEDWGVNARGLVLDGAPFTLDIGPAGIYGERLLRVHLLARNAENGKDVSIDASISGRNTTYGYTGAQCLPVPPVPTT
jgi:type II secretory pathway pseudopilin PulG